MRFPTTYALLTVGLLACSQARAQSKGLMVDNGAGVFAAPGNFATGYGVPSYGQPRRYSSFSSPYGPGYAYGYPPATFLPGPYGSGLWKPGTSAGHRFYSAYPVPYQPRPMQDLGKSQAPIGVIAPAFGPSLPFPAVIPASPAGSYTVPNLGVSSGVSPGYPISGD